MAIRGVRIDVHLGLPWSSRASASGFSGTFAMRDTHLTLPQLAQCWEISVYTVYFAVCLQMFINPPALFDVCVCVRDNLFI